MNRPKIGIGVLIFNQDSLLLGKRQESHGAHTWGPPGGHLEFGESFEEGGIREAKEETGLTLSSLNLIGLTNDFFRNDDKHYVSIFLKAKFPLGQMVANLEPHKVV